MRRFASDYSVDERPQASHQGSYGGAPVIAYNDRGCYRFQPNPRFGSLYDSERLTAASFATAIRMHFDAKFSFADAEPPQSRQGGKRHGFRMDLTGYATERWHTRKGSRVSAALSAPCTAR